MELQLLLVAVQLRVYLGVLGLQPVQRVGGAHARHDVLALRLVVGFWVGVG